MYLLRDYQKKAVEATIAYFKRKRDPALIVLPTGAGKSLVIAELARIAKGRVLVLAHVKELVEQNHAKFESYGIKAGIYSAGLDRKDYADKVIFGSIQSVARAHEDFFNDFSLLVVDECHRISTEDGTQYLDVIRKLQKNKPNLCILGLTATPYRLGLGWIYEYHYEGIVRTEEDRFFKRCVYEVSLGYMIKCKYLTPPVKIDSPVASYDFSELIERFHGKAIPTNEIEQLLKDQRRVTPAIIDNIVEISNNRRGVMIFTSTISHSREILKLLPDPKALILGDTPHEERDKIITDFKAQKIKYLVNVSVLTTGFDAPHVDVIAILRPTESVSLYQQIIGRGLRLYKGKEDCLVLDYTGLGHKIYSPEIGRNKPCKEAEIVHVECPVCGHDNQFWGIYDEHGEILEHFGHKCEGGIENADGLIKCGFRFRFSNCTVCGAENDLSARSCSMCHNALKDDKTKLKEARQAKDAHVMQPDSMTVQRSVDKKARERLEIRYYDLDGNHLTEYFYLSNDNDIKVFYYNFIRMHHKRPEIKINVRSINDALSNLKHFRIPMYLIAHKEQKFWRIREKIFMS